MPGERDSQSPLSEDNPSSAQDVPVEDEQAVKDVTQEPQCITKFR